MAGCSMVTEHDGTESQEKLQLQLNRAIVNGPASASFLETSFPALEVSQVAAADRRSRDPIYSAHRWWARRPPSLMRALLIASSLPDTVSREDFWVTYNTSTEALAGLRVHDPFMGGGSTLVEAARLGASVGGSDVDPTAVAIVKHCLGAGADSEVTKAGDEMLGFLRANFGDLYPDAGGSPLHYFWIPVVTCPACRRSGPLYRSLLLARDVGKKGGVVRDAGGIAFDPETFALATLRDGEQKSFQGTNRRWMVDRSTFSAFRYRCPTCKASSTHRELNTGSAPQRLVAIERTPEGARRVILEPSKADLKSITAAEGLVLKPPVDVRIPTVDFGEDRADPRPRSFGITAVRDLFTPRQLLVLGAAHAWLDSQGLEPAVDGALRLALSNSLATNNRLCSYARDYGRLSALFSVRGYSLPALSIELNPLHESGGRGTLHQCIERVARSRSKRARRASWDLSAAKPVMQEVSFLPGPARSTLRCASAADAKLKSPVDLLVFDPPYYDYIVYDELAELFRAWNPELCLGGTPLQSLVSGGTDKFGITLAECLQPALTVRRVGRPIAFTYHSSKAAAWEVIATALDEAKVRVTALWPVRTDGHMGHHSHPGNCEWDVVVVCRPVDETAPAVHPKNLLASATLFGDFDVGAADLQNFNLARQMASPRWGVVVAEPSGSQPV